MRPQSYRRVQEIIADAAKAQPDPQSMATWATKQLEREFDIVPANEHDNLLKALEYVCGLYWGSRHPGAVPVVNMAAVMYAIEDRISKDQMEVLMLRFDTNHPGERFQSPPRQYELVDHLDGTVSVVFAEMVETIRDESGNIAGVVAIDNERLEAERMTGEGCPHD